MRRAIAAAVMAAAIAGTASACGPSTTTAKPSVAACTKAYPAWFAASAAAGKTTATPAACKGLSDDQITSISTAYLASLSQ